MSHRPNLARIFRFQGCLALALLGAVTSARGQSPQDKAAAASLFEDGRKLMKQDKFPDACPKLEASYKIYPTEGTELNLALCHQKIGKIASAWIEYKDVVAASRRRGDAKREEFAQKAADELEPKIPKLTLKVDPKTATLPGLKVTRDGVSVDSGTWGAPIAVDPGTSKFEATATGYKAWSKVVTIDPSSQPVVTIPILVEEPKPVPTETATASTAAPTESSPSSAPSTPPAPPSFWTTGREAGVAFMGIGTVGLIVGGVFGALTFSNHSASNKLCPTNTTCTPQGVTDNNNAQTDATVSTIAFIAGGVLAGGGLLTFLLSGPHSSATVGQSSPSLHFALSPTPSGAMGFLGGTW